MKAPAFQLYARDFLADPLVDAMLPEELGGYFRLLLVAWQQDDPGYLPNDPDLLASWSRLGARWEQHGKAIMRCFRVAPDGRIYQKRMVEVWQEQEEYRNRQSAAGKIGNAKRWGSQPDREDIADESQPDRNPIATRIAVRSQPESQCDRQSIAEASPQHRSASASASEISDPPVSPPSGGHAPSETAKPPPRRRKRTVVPEAFRGPATEVLAELNAARKRVIPDARDLGPQDANLEHIAARLAEGHSLEDCQHAIAISEAEVRAGGDSGWFDAVTPFRRANFAKRLAMTVQSASERRGNRDPPPRAGLENQSRPQKPLASDVMARIFAQGGES